MITQTDINEIKKYQKWAYRKVYKNNSYYGRGKLLRTIVGLPSLFPILPYLQHGIAYGSISKRIEIIESLPYSQILLFSQFDFNRLASKVSKQLFHFPDVFPLYRQTLSSTTDEYSFEQKGTLYFPSHSSLDFQIDNNEQKIIDSLHQLPAKFHPITVSLYWLDILKGKHLAYEKNGFDVVTNGHRLDQNFYAKFYANLLRHQYTAGNDIGSHSFYSVEAGIPHFLYGPAPVSGKVRTVSDKTSNRETKSFTQLTRHQLYQTITNLFTFPDLDSITINEEITSWMNKLLGVTDPFDIDETRALIRQSFYQNPSKIFMPILNDLKRIKSK